MGLFMKGVEKPSDVYNDWWNPPKPLHLNFNNLANRDALLERAQAELGNVFYNAPAWYPASNSSFYTDGSAPVVKSNQPPYLQLRFGENVPIPTSITFVFNTFTLASTGSLQWLAHICPGSPASDYTQLARIALAHKSGDATASATAGTNNGVYNYSSDPYVLKTQLIGKASEQRLNTLKIYLRPILNANHISSPFRVVCTSFRTWSLANGSTGSYSAQIAVRDLYVDYE